MENEEVLESNETIGHPQYDLDKVYLFTEFPDKISGRCDNFNKAHFASSIKNGSYLRKCTNCGMTKRI
ncbi:hypothetical protein [Metabacillus fastidiosus]|uniref:hypothetical protein n=1 Tax=Metabacillus fastidiosus TaxID=1458 RepID=UPI002DBFF000|nr:hypothetical protein [Metabacillus fastidiosus]MEC2074572.1 hypothetical protein [Metabacillus fastidiosus]